MQALHVLALTAFILFPLTPSQAQEPDLLPVAVLQAEQQKHQPLPEAEILPDVKMLPKTNPETILFAHYKLSQSTPDMDSFAKMSPRVERAQEIDKSAMTISEYNRMTNRFNLLDPKKPIVIHSVLGLDEYSSLQNMLVFDELNDKTYFKFPVYGENIGIVPKDITKFNRLRISKASADKMFADLGGGHGILAEFILIPEYADRKTPFVHDETEYWLMLAQVAELRLWSKTGKEQKLAWYYRDPHYKPEDKNNLGGLYSSE